MKINKINLINYVVIPLLILVMSVFRDGNLQLLYAFSIVLFLICVKNKDYHLGQVLIILIPFILIFVVTMMFSSFYNSTSKSIIYLLKIFLCVNLYVIVQNANVTYKVINLNCIFNSLIVMILLLTAVAYFYRTDLLWVMEDKYNGFYEQRMRLLFMEPSELSQVTGLLFLFKFFKYLKTKNIKDLILGILVLIPMIFSAGLSGMIYTLVSFVLFLVIYEFYNFRRRRVSIITPLILLIVCLISFMFLLDSQVYLVARIQTIIDGNDMSFDYRYTSASVAFKSIMTDTHYIGVGLGNMNTKSTLDYLARFSMYKFSNSFMYFFSEGGIIAIIFVVIFFVSLFFRVIKNSNSYNVKCIRFTLLFFIIISQVAGGYFTNPLFWLIYGLIGSNSILECEYGICFLNNKVTNESMYLSV